MFFFGFTDTKKEPPLLLYNTLSGKEEPFEVLSGKEARMYTCGPTVYDFAHIGNLRSYVFADTLRRTLEYSGLQVKQVMNITDIGHLTSDADAGDDKMVKALKREGKSMTIEALREVAEKYTNAFLEDLRALNIKEPHILCLATEHIDAMIALIETLIQKEYAYKTSDGVYFDTVRFADYGKLGNRAEVVQEAGARIAVHTEKRNPADFVLWKLSMEEGLGWDAPWGRGFPGWHIECSAMSMQYLGKSFDIHTGGIDHIPIHHNNEIAQSEAATGRPLAHFWMHGAFLNIEGAKVAKSIGNTIYLRSLADHGFPALAYRYFLLTAHYRSPMNFTFLALEGAKTAYLRLVKYFVEELLDKTDGTPSDVYILRLKEALFNDLDTPRAVALLWELVKDTTLSPADKRATLLEYDKALGLGLKEIRKDAALGMTQIAVVPLKELPEEARLLVIAREEMREAKNWERADELRDELAKLGYSVKDTDGGTEVMR